VNIATSGKLTNAGHELPHEVMGTLLRLIRELRFGSIEIVVHEGRITQIERREKFRLSAPQAMERD